MSTSKFLWNPSSVLSGVPRGPFSLIILNQPIMIARDVMVRLWNTATQRVTVDGGTDRWLQWVKEMQVAEELKSSLPDLVTGDFDSIKQETLTMLETENVSVLHTPDQDKTDFNKSVECVLQNRAHNADHWIVAISEVGGRLDHVLSQLNTLHTFPDRIILLSANNATWVLCPGSHSIDVASLINSEILSHDRSLGLVPIGSSNATVTSTGLKWNLNNTVLKIGGLISTSNTYSGEPNINVVTDQPLLWTMSVALGKSS